MNEKTNKDKQSMTDIDVNAFIHQVAGADISEDMPVNHQEVIQAETPVSTEEKPKEQAKRKRPQAADYESLFLSRNEIRTRQGLYIGRDNYETLQTLVRSIRSERLSVSGFVDNIIRNHIETYEDEINRIYEENVRKPIKKEKQ